LPREVPSKSEAWKDQRGISVGGKKGKGKSGKKAGRGITGGVANPEDPN